MTDPKDAIKGIQQQLKAVGLYLGPIDGIWGNGSQRALDAALTARLVAAPPVALGGRFEACIVEILKYEGGWSDNPKDPGGATMKGVTLATYRAYYGADKSKADLRAISSGEISEIYRKGYWNAAHCGEVPKGVDLILFDLAVNSGPQRAIKMLQEAVGAKADGVFGPETKRCLYVLTPRAVVERLRNKRETFYRSLPTFTTFGRGWLRRLQDVSEMAKALAG